MDKQIRELAKKIETAERSLTAVVLTVCNNDILWLRGEMVANCAGRNISENMYELMLSYSKLGRDCGK